MGKKITGTFKLSPQSNSGLLYVPANLVIDSRFPIKEGSVIFSFEGKRLVVEQLSDILNSYQLATGSEAV